MKQMPVLETRTGVSKEKVYGQLFNIGEPMGIGAWALSILDPLVIPAV